MSSRRPEGRIAGARGFVIGLTALLAAAGARAQIPDKFTNLRVLPKDIAKPKLVETMRAWSGALGQRCDFCHVERKAPEHGNDFASDLQFVEVPSGKLPYRLVHDASRPADQWRLASQLGMGQWALFRLVDLCAAAGVRHFIVHARKAWLKGLSPKENREVPPLDYGRVYRLKAAHPELEIVINGGIGSLAEAEAHLAHVDGVALGRAAYQNPYLLAEVDRRLLGAATTPPSRREAIEALLPYAERHVRAGGRLNNIVRHILGLYHGQPRARAFRRHLSERAPREGAGADVLREALRLMEGPGSVSMLAAE